ncbi:MAG: hypothetical protein ACREK8_05215, partial [Gemmatimonadales bacterium]
MTTPRAELIHIEVDRRLGHEWDEWDGKPLPNAGNFDASPWLFFAWGAATMLAAIALAAGLLYLLAPRLRTLNASLPAIAWWIIAIAAAGSLLWWGLIGASFLGRVNLLPGFLAESGALLPLMRFTSRLSARFERRDRVENAAVKVYNRMALR